MDSLQVQNHNSLKVIFMGSPEFAVPSLLALVKINTLNNHRFEIVGVVTQPDKPVGRKQVMTPPPVKTAAQKLSLKIFQPQKFRTQEGFDIIKNLTPDLIIVVAYGKIIPKEIIDLPKYGVINVHASLLPKFRGASPIQTAIASGEKETGITIMLIDELMDHGPILAQKKINLSQDETSETLSKKLSILGAELLTKILPDWINGGIKPKEQNHAEATVAKMLTKEDGKINWNDSAVGIERKIRAYHPWPGSWTTWKRNGRLLKINILKIKPISKTEQKDLQTGVTFKTHDGFGVQTADGTLEILTLQPEGKKIMLSREFLNGYQDIIGACLSG